jgi:hypothetical protein
MAVILIEPIQVGSLGGNPVTITGFDPLAKDCIVGKVTFSGASNSRSGAWDIHGLMRDGSDQVNLDMRGAELKDLVNLIHQIADAN